MLVEIPADDPARDRELSFDEIKNIVDQARALGTRRWSISGGEPMLRPDFPEIFDYLTGKAVSYTLNTNGTLITPEIARLLTRKGTKMVALYGATQGDLRPRHPSSRRLREGHAGLPIPEGGGGGLHRPVDPDAGQLARMAKNEGTGPIPEQALARRRSLALSFRPVAIPLRNAEIARQRLDPRDVVELDQAGPLP